MRRRAGVSTGAKDGSNSEAAGTDGIAVPRQRLARDGVEAARATAITLTYAEDL